MPLLGWIVVFAILGGVLSVLAASLFMVLPARIRERLMPTLVSFATGALLGAAFLGLIPHAIQSPGVDDPHTISGTILLGVLAFFVMEKLVLWRHCHAEHCEAHAPETAHHHADVAASRLILVGDAIHNLVDGVLIAAAFLTDFHLGVVTSLAVIAHEIPQEVGDFAILLNGGYTRARALFFNTLSSLTTIVGAIVAYYSLAATMMAVPYVLAVAAASFIYIAVADLIPGLHRRMEPGAMVHQLVLIVAGVSLIYVVHSTMH
jgi:zinc and cadmium transporter